jgi:hypothetical protein
MRFSGQGTLNWIEGKFQKFVRRIVTKVRSSQGCANLQPFENNSSEYTGRSHSDLMRNDRSARRRFGKPPAHEMPLSLSLPEPDFGPEYLSVSPIRTRLRKAIGTFHPDMLHTNALMCLLRDTSDQLLQPRKQKLKDGRLVGLFVPENPIDNRSISLERTARYRPSEKVLGVSG